MKNSGFMGKIAVFCFPVFLPCKYAFIDSFFIKQYDIRGILEKEKRYFYE